MKRAIALIVCLCALVCGAGWAEPAEDVGEGIRLQIDQDTIALKFDSSKTYSMISDGYVQASFYVGDDTQAEMRELYMVFPETVESGAVVTPDGIGAENPECMVAYIYSTSQSEVYYYAGLEPGAAHPDSAAYEIAFDTVTEGEGSRTYTGRLNATLMGTDLLSNEAYGPLVIVDAPFSFTMPEANRKELDGNPFIDDPAAPSEQPEAKETAPEPTPRETYRV